MYSISSKYLLPTLWTIQVRQAKPIIFAVMLNVKYCPFQNFPKDALHSFFFIFFKSPRQDNLHFTTWIQRKHFCCLLRFRRIPPLISLFLKARVCVDYSSLTKTSTGLLRVGERRQLSGYWGVTLGFTLSCTQVKRSSYNNFWVVGGKKRLTYLFMHKFHLRCFYFICNFIPSSVWFSQFLLPVLHWPCFCTSDSLLLPPSVSLSTFHLSSLISFIYFFTRISIFLQSYHLSPSCLLTSFPPLPVTFLLLCAFP